MGAVSQGTALGASTPGGPEDRLLAWPEVKRIAGLSRSTVWRMQQVGEFPLPVQVSRGRVGWWASELSIWKQARQPHRLPEPRTLGREAVQPGPGSAEVPRVEIEREAGPAAGEAAVLGEHRGEDPPAPAPARRAPRRRSIASADQIAFDFGA